MHYDQANSPAKVANFRHLMADIGRFLEVIICMDGAKIRVCRGFRPQMKFGTVVAPVFRSADGGNATALEAPDSGRSDTPFT